MRSSVLQAVLLMAVLAAAALGGFFLLRGVGRRSPLDALPADAVLVLQSGNAPRLMRSLARAPLPAGTSGSATELMAELLRRPLRDRAFPLETTIASLPALLERIDGQAILAFVPGEDEGIDDMALIMSVGGGSERFVEEAEAIGGAIFGPGSGWSVRRHRGWSYGLLRSPVSGARLAFAGLRGLVIVTTSASAMRGSLDTILGERASLAADPVFRTARRRAGSGADLFVYVPGDRVRAWAERHAGPLSGRLARLMGLARTRGIGLSVDLRRRGIRERLFAAQTRDKEGGAGRPFDTSLGESSMARLMPADLPFHLAFSLKGLIPGRGGLADLLAGASGGDRRETRARLKGLEEFLAIDLDEDLLAAAGDQILIGFGSASPYPRGASSRAIQNLPAVVALPLRRRSAAGDLLRRIDGLARALGSYQVGQLGDGSITTYPFPSLAPMVPSYRIEGSHLVAATSPELLVRALGAAAAGTSLADREELAEALELLPERSHFMLCADTHRLLDLSVPPVHGGAWLSMLRALAAQGALPPTVLSGRVMDEGVQVEWISPMSPGLVIGLAAWGGVPLPDEAGQPSMAVREEAEAPY